MAMRIFLSAIAALITTPAVAAIPGADTARQTFTAWMAENHVPGLVWGVVKDGQLVHVEGLGVADTTTQRPVTADTAFRIASMSKAFTARAALALVEQGRLRLDDGAAKYVPELAGWGNGITVGNLMYHTAGFVTDDPWGDRQQPLPEADFTAMLKAGVPFQRAPGVAYEYSNFGYATLGRVVGNVTGHNFADEIRDTVFRPLGMTSTTHDVRDVPRDRLALPYRWQDGRWTPEPEMKAGAFGAMGGVVTTATDYAKWVGWLLQGWPVAAQPGQPNALQRAMRDGGGFTHFRTRPGKDGEQCRQQQLIYAAGLVAGTDCILGAMMFHSGGYPGYGSHMLLLPEAGVGIFAFANRTYAGPTAPVWDVAGQLAASGFIAPRPVPVSATLAQGYAAAQRIWAAGSVTAEKPLLAMNFLLDADAAMWATTLKELAAASGHCDTTAAITPAGALSGTFRWVCEKGTLNGQLLMAPTATPQIQALRLKQP